MVDLDWERPMERLKQLQADMRAVPAKNGASHKIQTSCCIIVEVVTIATGLVEVDTSVDTAALPFEVGPREESHCRSRPRLGPGVASAMAAQRDR
jgi:hypothetical protein